MIPGMQNQIAISKEQALAAFVSRKAEVDAMLARLQALRRGEHARLRCASVCTWGWIAPRPSVAFALQHPARPQLMPDNSIEPAQFR